VVNWSRVCLHFKYEQREIFYVVAAVLTQILVFGDVMPCRLSVELNAFHLQGQESQVLVLLDPEGGGVTLIHNC
jgi:hypothetical protein